MLHDLPFLDPAFYQPVLFGILGLVVNFLLKWKNPEDDTISGAFGKAFREHSLSTFVGFVAYLVACIAAHNSGTLNSVAAFGLGYVGQSLSTNVASIASGKGGTS